MNMITRTVRELQPGDRVFTGLGRGGAIVDRIIWETPNSPEIRIVWELECERAYVRSDFLPTEKVYIYPPGCFKLAKYLVAGDVVKTDIGVKTIKAIYRHVNGSLYVQYEGFFQRFAQPDIFDPEDDIEIKNEN